MSGSGIEVIFRGPGMTRRQHLKFSVDRGLEGMTLREYQFAGWGLKSLRLDTPAIEGYEIESEVNPAAGCFLVLTFAGAVGFAVAAFVAGFNLLFWLVVMVLILGAVSELFAATWWAELKIRRRGSRRPVVVPVAGYSKKSVAAFMDSVMEEIESATGEAG